MERLRKHFIVLTCVYIIILIWGIIFKMNAFAYIEYSVNWTLENDPHGKGTSFFPPIPFPAWYFSLQTTTGREHLLNFIVFIPFGFLLTPAFKKAILFKVVFASFSLSLIFELTQLFVAFGGCALLDLIFNTFGAVVGFGIFAVLLGIVRLFGEHAQEKFLKLFLVLGYIVLLPIAIYGSVNTIINVDFYITLQNKWLALL